MERNFSIDIEDLLCRTTDAVAYVPCSFVAAKGVDGVLRARPAKGFGYVAVGSRRDASAALRRIEDLFKTKGFGGFEDIEGCVAVSFETLHAARAVLKAGGSFVLRTYGCSGGRLDADDIEGLSSVDWYATYALRLRDVAEWGFLCAKGASEADCGLVWFTIPRSCYRMKGSMGILREFESMYGERIDFSLDSRRTIGHERVAPRRSKA